MVHIQATLETHKMSEMSPEVETQGIIDILVKAARGCAVINGEIATQLEVRGAVFDKMLWSAICLITEPHLIKQVYDYLYSNFK